MSRETDVFDRRHVLYEKPESTIVLPEDPNASDASTTINAAEAEPNLNEEAALTQEAGFGCKILEDFGTVVSDSKGIGQRDITLIVFVVEDEARTFKYFRSFQCRIRRGYQIEPCSKRGGVPFPHMIQEAKNAVRKHELDFSIGDRLFMISDLDHYRDSILQQHGSIDPNFTLILSNPCIEIWFHYHYSADKPAYQEFAGLSEKLCPARMKTYNGRHNRGGGINYTRISTVDLDIPCKHSRDNYEEEENQIIPKLFSTQMHIVGELLKPLLK